MAEAEKSMKGLRDFGGAGHPEPSKIVEELLHLEKVEKDVRTFKASIGHIGLGSAAGIVVELVEESSTSWRSRFPCYIDIANSDLKIALQSGSGQSAGAVRTGKAHVQADLQVVSVRAYHQLVTESM